MKRCLNLVRRCHAGNSLPGSCASPEPEQPWQRDEQRQGSDTGGNQPREGETITEQNLKYFKYFKWPLAYVRPNLKCLTPCVLGYLCLLHISSSMTGKLINSPAFGASGMRRIAQPTWDHLVKQHLQFVSIFRLRACKSPHIYLTRSMDEFGQELSNFCHGEMQTWWIKAVYFSYALKCKNTQPWETPCESHFHCGVC